MATVIHTEAGEHVIERMPLRVLVNYERKNKGESPKTIEGMAWCAHQTLRRRGTDVPDDFEAFIDTVEGIEIDDGEDDDGDPT